MEASAVILPEHNKTMTTSTTSSAVSTATWNSLRERFKTSMMAKTEINKLAQNLDLSWPIRSRDEIPLKYLPLTIDEVVLMPGIVEAPDRLQLLVEILSETLAFDDPFSEMAEYVDSSSKKDDGTQKALEKFGIPIDFPIQLCALGKETREFIRAESIHTLGEFIDFSQTMAQSIVVGGDFRAFLNALAHPEEATIATFLPYRPGHKGLQLAEAVAQTLDLFDPSERLFILEQAGAPIEARDRRETLLLSTEQQTSVLAKARNHMELIYGWFESSREDLANASAEGPGFIERIFVPLENPQTETVSLWLVRESLNLETPTAHTQKKKGFFSRFFGG